jgi:hypothetical protein
MRRWRKEHSMTTTFRPATTTHRAATILLRIVVVALATATAIIHARLGGLLFTLNALGYLALTTAMVLPGPFGRIRWLTRVALIGFTTATIIGWVLIGPRFPLAYLDKGVEIVLIAFLTFEVWLDGGPSTIFRHLRHAIAVARHPRPA